jgi:hypothetical protein
MIHTERGEAELKISTVANTVLDGFVEMDEQP